MKNNLADLSNHLFSVLEELQDGDERSPEKLKALVERSKAVCSVSKQILDVAKTQVSAMRTAEACGLLNKDMPALIAVKDSKAGMSEKRKLLESLK